MDQNPQDPQAQSQPIASPVAPVAPAAPPRRHAGLVRAFFGALGPILVIGALAGFVVYSLYIYKPADGLACSTSTMEQQVDIAVNVVRQWFGQQGQDYAGCPTP